MLWGHGQAKIDDKGRLKVPAVYRSQIAAAFGDELFVTSLKGESVLIYPMKVWEAMAEARRKNVPSELPALRRYLREVNYFGNQAEFDRQGRVLINGRLREKAEMVGEVEVFGQVDHLEVWNHGRVQQDQEQNPLTDEDLGELAKYGV